MKFEFDAESFIRAVQSLARIVGYDDYLVFLGEKGRVVARVMDHSHIILGEICFNDVACSEKGFLFALPPDIYFLLQQEGNNPFRPLRVETKADKVKVQVQRLHGTLILEEDAWDHPEIPPSEPKSLVGLDWSFTGTISSDILKDAVTPVKAFGSVGFRATDSMLELYGEGDSELRISKGVYIHPSPIVYQIPKKLFNSWNLKNEVEVGLSESFLRPLIEGIPEVTGVTLSMMADYPLKISFNFDESIGASFWLAPRITAK